MADTFGPSGRVMRPSYLTGWADCSRRTAARMFPELIESAGYELRSLAHSVGMSVGLAVHAGAKMTLQSILDRQDRGALDDVLDFSMETFKTEISEGIMWDRVTGDLNAGQQQIRRMVEIYRDEVVPGIKVVSVEERLEADVADGYIISGQKDLLAREKLDFGNGMGITDLKTGAMRRSNAAQYGAYSLIDRSHGREIDGLKEVFVARATLKKPQPAPVIVEYDIAACEALADAIVDDVKRSVGEFERRLSSGKRPPEGAFLANPYSMLCGEKYCSAWGTNFCRVHKKADVVDSINEQSGVNRRNGLGDQYSPDPNCIASRCMAWRWGAGEFHPDDIAHKARSAANWAKTPTKGYRGMAGKP